MVFPGVMLKHSMIFFCVRFVMKYFESMIIILGVNMYGHLGHIILNNRCKGIPMNLAICLNRFFKS